jgi:peptide deformylase
MINPTITRSRGNQKYVEGWLSVPGKYIEVPRFQKVWCTYLDENGQEQEIAQGGRMSNIIQHEMDHFDGVCRVSE